MSGATSRATSWLLAGACMATGCLSPAPMFRVGDLEVPTRVEPYSRAEAAMSVEIEPSGRNKVRCEVLPCSLCLPSGTARVQATLEGKKGEHHSYERLIDIPDRATRLQLERNNRRAFITGALLLPASVLLLTAIPSSKQIGPAAELAMIGLSVGLGITGAVLMMSNWKRDHVHVKPWQASAEDIQLQCRDSAPPAGVAAPAPLPSERPEMLRIAGGAVVPPFLIDRQEVTVEQYRACMRANACTAPDRAPLCTFGEFARGGYPVNCVSQSQAADYCHCAGKRLPTDDEWEYLLVHYGASARAEPRSPVRADVGPAPAGSYLAASGLADLVGNVWQWSASPAGMSWGGSWDSEPVYVRDYSQLRNPVQPGWKLPTMGFRCAAER